MLTRRTVLAGVALPGAPGRIVVERRMLSFGALRVRCAVGRGGVKPGKREGDGATPSGVFPLREVLFRPDRGPAPETRLPVSPIAAADGWSDDPADPGYNRRAPMGGSFHREPLWRPDALYDVLAVIGANDDPALPGRGSAIFLHVARPDFGPTEGCVAVAKPDLLRLLAQCGLETQISISA